MAGFRFRLEVVRRQRRQAVDIGRRDVALALRAVQDMEGRMASVFAEMEQVKDGLRQSRRAGIVDALSLARLERHYGNLKRRHGELTMQRDHAAEQLEERRIRLATATKNLKAIEKLREKQWSRFVQEGKRRQTADMDEIALQQHVRAASEHGRNMCVQG